MRPSASSIPDRLAGRFQLVLLVYFLASFLVAFGARGASLEVFVPDRGSEPLEHPVQVVLSTGSEPGDPALGSEVPAGGSVRFGDLDRGLWQVRVEAPNRWTEPTLIHVAEGSSQSITLPLYPVAALRGSTVFPAEEGPPETLRVLFSPVQPRSGAGPPDSGSVACTTGEDRFRCALPAGRWNLRLRTPGHVSHFFWDLLLEPGRTEDLGELTFEEGSSVFGFVPSCEGEERDDSCRVDVRPFLGPAPSPEQARQGELLISSAGVDQRGFFLIDALPPGSYELIARQAGFSPKSLFPIRVFPGAETEVAEPIVLERPVEVTVRVEPPTDPSGRSWELDLLEMGLATGVSRPVARGTFADGTWESPPLAPGNYHLMIRDAAGQRWHVEPLEVSRERRHFPVRLPIIAVEGRVSLGEEPLAADLFFGGRFGARRIRTVSDEEGEFFVHLPETESWRVAVHADDPPVQRTLGDVVVPEPESGRARLELRLPGTRIFGTAVDVEGLPVPDALVTAVDPERRGRPETLRTDERGRFTFLGLGPGTLHLSARRGDLQSEEQHVQLADEEARTPVFLTLRAGEPVVGEVRSPSGPVVGARLRLTPTGSSFGDLTTTDVRGRFSTRLPADTPSLDVVVLSPASPLTARRVPASAGKVRVGIGNSSGDLAIPGGLGPLQEGIADDELVILLHEQVVIPVQTLAEWQRIQRSMGRQVEIDGADLLPQLASGSYRLCTVSVAEMAGVARGAAEPTRCISTFVVHGGTAVLDPHALAERKER